MNKWIAVPITGVLAVGLITIGVLYLQEIDKLKEASSLKVMTITGSIIRNIKDQDMGIHGNQITWDGKDSQGRWVNSGVYLLAVYDQIGDSNIGKITVIRH